MTKRLSVTILFLFSLFIGYAERLKCVEIADYDHVNFDACYLQFPAQRQKQTYRSAGEQRQQQRKQQRFKFDGFDKFHVKTPIRTSYNTSI